MPLLAFLWPWTLATTALVAAAAAPILIHLWNRRQYRTTAWAAMEYLLAAMKKNAERLQVEQWLLLAVRVLILLLAAVALADPAFSCRLAPALGTSLEGGHTHTVLAIDGSFSMNYRAGEQTRFDRARQLATELVEQHTQGDGFTLLVIGDTPRAVIAEPAYNPQDVVDELAALQQPHGGAQLAPAVAEIRRLIATAQANHPRLSATRVVLFTDLGRHSWQESQTPALQAALAELGQSAELQLVDLGLENAENLALTNLEQLEPYATIGRPVTLRAEVRNFGVAARTSVPIEFLVDDRQVHREVIEVAAGGRATTQLTYAFETPGDHVVEVRLAGDALEVDNHRWHVVPVRDAVRVLVVGGGTRATYFLARILEPTRQERPRIRVQEATESALLETDLRAFDCVFLSNVGRISGDEAALLRSYLEGGGGLVIFLGDEVQPENYNQQLGAAAAHERPILPARLGQPEFGQTYEVDPLDYAHPIVAPFRGHERSGLLTTPLWKYIRLEPRPEAKSALAIVGGGPLIVAERWPRGGCVLVGTAASTASVERSTTPPTPWTMLPTWSSFGPLVHEMLAWTLAGQNQGRNLLVGQEIRGSLPTPGGDLSLKLVRPSGAMERLRMSVNGDAATWGFAATDVSGPYEAILAEPGLTQRFAVNVNTVESDLARLDPDLLPPVFAATAPAERASGGDLAEARRWELFRALLAIVLALVLVESFLAWHFGSRRL